MDELTEIPLVSVKCRAQDIVRITENIILTGCKGTNKQQNRTLKIESLRCQMKIKV